MKQEEVVNREKFNKVLANPQLDNEKFQKVFAYVENITGQNISIDHLTPAEVEIWNYKFDQVIEQLIDDQCEK